VKFRRRKTIKRIYPQASYLRALLSTQTHVDSNDLILERDEFGLTRMGIERSCCAAGNNEQGGLRRLPGPRIRAGGGKQVELLAVAVKNGVQVRPLLP
jgi:hypothetical protein